MLWAKAVDSSTGYVIHREGHQRDRKVRFFHCPLIVAIWRAVFDLRNMVFMETVQVRLSTGTLVVTFQVSPWCHTTQSLLLPL